MSMRGSHVGVTYCSGGEGHGRVKDMVAENKESVRSVALGNQMGITEGTCWF